MKEIKVLNIILSLLLIISCIWLGISHELLSQCGGDLECEEWWNYKQTATYCTVGLGIIKSMFSITLNNHLKD